MASTAVATVEAARPLAARPVGMPAPIEARPFVSVVIPHYNDLENLARCLDRLERQTWPRDSFEVIVADNNSRCGLDAVRATAGRARVVPAPIQGAGPARNAGVAAARGAILAFIDSDCFAEPGWLAAGVAALDHYDYVGGEVVTDIADPGAMSIAEAYEAVFAFRFRKYIERERFSGTGNLFVPRRVFERTGPFRAGVSEDKEWCLRANGAGFRLGYAGEAIVAHPARRTFRELMAKWDRVVVESYLLEREKSFGHLRWIARIVATAGSPLPHSIMVLRHQRLSGPANKLKGLAGLAAIRLYRCWRMILAPFDRR
jgi:glycosyltransferase involved in cell wall biosynthesis